MQPRKSQAGSGPSDTEPLLTAKLKTLLQVGRAFEVAYGLDAKPADVGSIEAALLRQLDEFEPCPTRATYLARPRFFAARRTR